MRTKASGYFSRFAIHSWHAGISEFSVSGSQISSAGLDPRRRRALFRAWHRGMREMDLIMGRFADAEIGTLSEAELDSFEALLDAPDQDAFSWLTGEVSPPPDYDTDLFQRLLAFKTEGGAVAS
jgi:antitoxin CptB